MHMRLIVLISTYNGEGENQHDWSLSLHHRARAIKMPSETDFVCNRKYDSSWQEDPVLLELI